MPRSAVYTGEMADAGNLTMKKTASALVAGLTAILMLLAGPVAAVTVLDEARDPQDVRGRLDIVLVRVASRGESVVLTVRTAERWGCGYLTYDYVTGQRSASLRWQFRADPTFDSGGYFSCSDGRYKFRTTRNGPVYKAWRPNRRTIKVAVPAMRHPALELHAISRVDQLRADGGPLIDEEDWSPGLRPNR